MEEIGILNDRKIFYQKHAFDINWAKPMPDKNWLLFVIVENKHKRVLSEITNKAIDKNVCCVCCVGEQAELMHDFIDEEIAFREADIDDHYLPPYDVIMTTWHSDLDEALWFAIFAAYNAPEIIDTIFCLDASKSSVKSELENLIKQYLTGNE